MTCSRSSFPYDRRIVNALKESFDTRVWDRDAKRWTVIGATQEQVDSFLSIPAIAGGVEWEDEERDDEGEVIFEAKQIVTPARAVIWSGEFVPAEPKPPAPVEDYRVEVRPSGSAYQLYFEYGGDTFFKVKDLVKSLRGKFKREPEAHWRITKTVLPGLVEGLREIGGVDTSSAERAAFEATGREEYRPVEPVELGPEAARALKRLGDAWDEGEGAVWDAQDELGEMAESLEQAGLWTVASGLTRKGRVTLEARGPVADAPSPPPPEPVEAVEPPEPEWRPKSLAPAFDWGSI